MKLYPVRTYKSSEELPREEQLAKLLGWRLTPDGRRIRKEWTVKHFVAGMDFFQAVAKVAEQEQHDRQAKDPTGVSGASLDLTG